VSARLCVWTAGHASMDTPATPPPARYLSHIGLPVLFRDQRTQQNMTTMVVKRCGFCAIRSARPDRSFPLSRPTKTVTPTTGGMISHSVSQFHFPRVPTHVVLTRRRRSPKSRARHPRLPAAATKNDPSQLWERTSSSTAWLHAYATVHIHTIVIKDEQRHSIERC